MTFLDDVAGHEAYALIRLRDADTLTVLAGRRRDLSRLSQIPDRHDQLGADRRYESLTLIPFAQIRERGFDAHQDGTPLTCLEIDHEAQIPLDKAIATLPDVPIEFADRGGFETDDAAYGDMVEAIIRDEIGRGEGANLVIGRDYRAQVAGWDHASAQTILRRLLERERGAYWTFCVFTGDRFLIGASPERHVSVEGGQVRMNPISGTFRLRGIEGQAARKRALLDFLADEKEIYELFMVVDEELKMMCDICSEGGLVLGPYLKQMTHLVHSEYLLAGRTSRDPREVLRDTMFAATVTGSPVQNACRLIKQYEPRGRGYYGAVMGLLGRDDDGRPSLDAPILIRTADVDLDGRIKISAGATLVRDSDAAYETAETHAKAGGILTAFGLVDAPTAPEDPSHDLTRDDDVLVALGARNQRLSSFWLSDQSRSPAEPVFAGRSAVILDGEDDFVNMLRHVLAALGMSSRVVRHQDWAPGALDGDDLVIVGPGPGDPRAVGSAKIATFRAALAEVLAARRPILAVCLGHQVLCDLLGLPVGFKDIVFQGTQARLPVNGRDETVGFYNTFVARCDASGPPVGVSVQTEPGGADIHLVTAPGVRGVQFHAESILTQRGDGIIRDLVTSLLAERPRTTGPGD